MDTGGAIPVRNEKGEISMKKVKVQRYVAGKLPSYAIGEEDNEVQNTVIIDEVEDKRLKRLSKRENFDKNEARRRHIMEPTVIIEEDELHENEMDISDSEEHDVVVKQEEENVDEEERLRHREIIKQRLLDKQREDELLRIEEEVEPVAMTSEEESEYEELSEVEEDKVVVAMLKPVFVNRNDRLTIKEIEIERQKEKDAEFEMKLLRDEAVKQTKKLIEEDIRQERMSEKKVDENISCDFNTDDDEQDESEYESWKLRELKRIKRDRDEREARNREKEEKLRLREMTDEERLAKLHLKTITNEPVKGKYKFLQKYYHRGAFFMHEEQDVFKRNFSEPTLEDRFDKTILPKVMQVKNFGMAGRTKYTHLVDQDTSSYKDNPWDSTGTFIPGGLKQTFERPSAKKRKF
jgi:microfibrillar-associated protein 1